MVRPTDSEDKSSRAQTIRELHELIIALDRRVPQVERAGETAIARLAGALKSEALKRLEELEGSVARLRGASPVEREELPAESGISSVEGMER